MNQISKQTVALKWSLFRNLIILIVFIAIGILITITFIGKRSLHALSEELIVKTSANSRNHINQIFAPAKRTLEISKQLALKKVFLPNDYQSMNNVFIPFLSGLPYVTSLNTGDADGNAYLLLELDDLWKNRIVKSDYVGQKTYWLEFNEKERLVKEYWKKVDYDPRKRPWYKISKDSNGDEGVQWTAPYVFFTTKDLGITASIGVAPPGSNPYVLAFDIMLKDISTKTFSQRVSDNGFVTVITEDGKLIGLPGVSHLKKIDDLKQLLLQPISELKIPALSKAFEIWQTEKSSEGNIFKFSVDGRAWWASFAPYRLSEKDHFLIGVLVPEDDIMKSIQHQEMLLGLITLIALLIAGLMAVYLAKKYSIPLELLVKQTEAISQLDLSGIDNVNSDIKEVAHLASAHEKMKTALDSFTRYISIDVVRELMKRGEAANVGGSKKCVSILFTDIADFTSIAESMDPEVITHHMTEYFENMLTILKSNHATIDKLIGDAIVAFWNAPNDIANHESIALKAVIECKLKLNEINERWKKEGKPELHTRFGLHVGEVIVGNLGSSQRLDYTILGDAVNLASRLEGLNKYYGTEILVSQTVKDAVAEGFEWRLVDKVKVKGRTTDAINIYEILGYVDGVSREQGEFADNYQRAFDLFLKRKFQDALDVLNSLQNHKDDLSLQRLVAKCEKGLENPADENFDGSTSFTDK